MKNVLAIGTGLVMLIGTGSAMAAVPEPLTPSGVLTTRSPVFKWTDTGASHYTVELTVDKSAQEKRTVSAPRMELAAPLEAGVYRWRVKEGNLASTQPWSSPAHFTVRLFPPDPLVPDHRLTPVPATPRFEWDNDETQADRYNIQLYKNQDLLDTATVNGAGIGEYLWPASLPAGTYTWRIRNVRTSPDPDLVLKSEWTEPLVFAVGVPLPPLMLAPSEGDVRNPGDYNLLFQWLKREGSSNFFARLLRNGEAIQDWPAWPTNSMTMFRSWTPGHYSFLVRGVNAYGNGAWCAPRSFTVRRNMVPGGDLVLTGSPARLEWTRSPDATRYRIRLFRGNPATGLYELIKEGSVNQPVGQPKWNPGALGSGAYRWQVTDFLDDKPLFTSADYFSIGVPSRPDALAPLEDVTGFYDVRFGWKMASASPTHYQFQLLKGGVTVKDTGWKPTSEFKGGDYEKVYNLAASGAGVYRWRVRAKNAIGPGGWRDTQFALASLPKPVITTPANNSEYPIGTKIDITWKSVPAARYYRIQFWNNGVMSGEYGVSITGGAPVSYAWNVGIGLWTIRVRAVDEAHSAWAVRNVTGVY